MAADVVGREQELGALHAFLERPLEGPAAFVLEGEAGIGKSTLWLAGVAAARDSGFLVLPSRPAEAERGLAHVVLGDLFEPVLDDVLPVLTAPRRRALEAALLVDHVPDAPVDPRALGVAIRSSLEALARRGPLVAPSTMTSGSTPPRRTLCNSRYDDCAVSTSASSWRGGSTITRRHVDSRKRSTRTPSSDCVSARSAWGRCSYS